MSRKKGDIAEKKACDYLRALGYEIVDQNVYSRFGEIDIVTCKNGVYHFIEVKSALSFELAIQNITPSKISKLIKTIDVYRKKVNLTSDYQLDAVVVTPDGCELLEAITV